MIERRSGNRTRRTLFTAGAVVLLTAGCHKNDTPQTPETAHATAERSSSREISGQALQALGSLAIKGRAPMTGYARDRFGHGWSTLDGCDTRDRILQRDLLGKTLRSDGCEVASGVLHDPYTGKTISFHRGVRTSSAVQIDHMVALGDAWQTGAQQLSPSRRQQLANDPLELLAVDGPANEQKGDADAASWLPPNKAFRCAYVARQIAVKLRYELWVTPPEHTAMQQVLDTCPAQALPTSP